MRIALTAVLALIAVIAAGDDDVVPRFICHRPTSLCGGAAATPWDRTSCDDLQFDDALIESAANGGRSAIALLQQRYDGATTYAERIHLGGALVGRVDDGAIWKELAAYAERAVELHLDVDTSADKIKAYCAQHDCDPRTYDELLWQAFDAAAGDRRAHGLCLRALSSNDSNLVGTAIGGVARQHDASSLVAIDKALAGSIETTRRRWRWSSPRSAPRPRTSWR